MFSIDEVTRNLQGYDLTILRQVRPILERIISEKTETVRAEILARHRAILEEAAEARIPLQTIRPYRKWPAQYRNPENQKQTWTGKGKCPNWLKQKLAEGFALESFLIEETVE